MEILFNVLRILRGLTYARMPPDEHLGTRFCQSDQRTPRVHRMCAYSDPLRRLGSERLKFETVPSLRYVLVCFQFIKSAIPVPRTRVVLESGPSHFKQLQGMTSIWASRLVPALQRSEGRAWDLVRVYHLEEWLQVCRRNAWGPMIGEDCQVHRRSDD